MTYRFYAFKMKEQIGTVCQKVKKKDDKMLTQFFALFIDVKYIWTLTTWSSFC